MPSTLHNTVVFKSFWIGNPILFQDSSRTHVLKSEFTI